jgi:hypothetical protein
MRLVKVEEVYFEEIEVAKLIQDKEFKSYEDQMAQVATKLLSLSGYKYIELINAYFINLNEQDKMYVKFYNYIDIEVDYENSRE